MSIATTSDSMKPSWNVRKPTTKAATTTTAVTGRSTALAVRSCASFSAARSSNDKARLTRDSDIMPGCIRGQTTMDLELIHNGFVAALKGLDARKVSED